MDPSLIANNCVKNVASGDVVTLSSIWQNKTSVIIFFRRWGCLFCRVWARELSALAPILKKHDIQFVGIGPEDIGINEFIEGRFFDGEIYLDVDKKTYNGLEFKRFNYFSILTSLLWKESRAAFQKAKSLQLTGDLKGDGLQMGGALVIDGQGKVLLFFKQEGPAEHLTNERFLEALHLELEIQNLKSVEKEEMHCTTEKCTLENKSQVT